MAERPIVVQKFGGTSVADDEARAAVASKVREALESGFAPVLVVSAMGRAGSAYATDTLLGLLESFEPDPRESDMLASCGETISCVLVAHALRDAGVKAKAMSGAAAGILTDGRFTEAEVVSVDPAPLLTAVSEGQVPVVAGFQGVSEEGETTTLGRGGSDTTACALAVALGAQAVEIYTDVDGVMTADPRECEGVRVLDRVSYEELFQMARHGSKVVHTPAAELAMNGGVEMRVKNTFSSSKGTSVTAEMPKGEGRVATGVSHIDGVARIAVSLPPEVGDPSHMAAQTKVYRSLAEADVSLDMFTPLEGRLVFSISEADLPTAMKALDKVGLPYDVTTGLAKVTLVGAGMHGVPGVMARLAEALDDARVTVLQAADSHATISVLVWQNTRKAAVKALHDAFGLGGGC